MAIAIHIKCMYLGFLGWPCSQCVSAYDWLVPLSLWRDVLFVLFCCSCSCSRGGLCLFKAFNAAMVCCWRFLFLVPLVYLCFRFVSSLVMLQLIVGSMWCLLFSWSVKYCLFGMKNEAVGSSIILFLFWSIVVFVGVGFPFVFFFFQWLSCRQNELNLHDSKSDVQRHEHLFSQICLNSILRVTSQSIVSIFEQARASGSAFVCRVF